MTLAEKLRHLRAVEGMQRGLGRPLTKAELSRLMRQQLGADAALSPAYLSQLESGARSHMTEHTRHKLAAFFKVHPGYLVSDPAGFETELQSDLAPAADADGDRLSAWLGEQAERWRDDPLVAHILLKLWRQPHRRQTLELLDALLDLPPERLERLVGSLASTNVGRAG